MKKTILLIGLILLLFAFKELTLFEKKILPNFIALLQDIPQEKVYLHTDKDSYIVGEKIWFRAYLIHVSTYIPFVHSRFIYVNIDKTGTVFLSFYTADIPDIIEDITTGGWVCRREYH